MPQAQIRKSSQITLPKEIKQALAVNEGDFVDFVIENGKVYLLPVKMLHPSDVKERFLKNMRSVYAQNKEVIAQHSLDVEDDITTMIVELRTQAS